MKRQPTLIGVGGGSGVGKTTVAFAIHDQFPDKVAIVHLDDYQKQREQMRFDYGLPNWDHPSAISWELLLRDLLDLRQWKSITVMTKNKRFNPDYKNIGRLPMTVKPKPIIVVEGYLALYHPEVRKQLNYKVFLDGSEEIRMQRRDKFLSDTYRDKILIPMHQEFVEPTREYADVVVAVTNHNAAQVLTELTNVIPFQALI
jgi:uridine kinase